MRIMVDGIEQLCYPSSPVSFVLCSWQLGSFKTPANLTNGTGLTEGLCNSMILSSKMSLRFKKETI